MQRLEKTVLRTAADTTPDHRPGDISHRAVIDAYRLAEALHHQLLKVIGQEAEALVVGQYRLAAVAERVAVPHCGQRMPHRQILSQWLAQHMRIHCRRAGDRKSTRLNSSH